jgi:hypothetical protein
MLSFGSLITAASGGIAKLAIVFALLSKIGVRRGGLREVSFDIARDAVSCRKIGKRGG